MEYTLPALGYDYNALEPHIDAKTMEIHHTKHHQAYITNLNNALQSTSTEGPQNVNDLIKDISKLPASIQTAVRNNGGGHSNHTFFWTILSPNGGGTPQGKLAKAIEEAFGGFHSFQEQFNKAATTRFGSGWAWLVVKPDNSLAICSTANQDSPIMQGVCDCTGTPVIGLDVWEHAYYLNYQNRRPDYISAFWKVIDWHKADQNYQAALS